MSATSPIALHLRSYGALRQADRHAYAQLVLPLRGAVRLDIAGSEERVDPLRAAVVAPGAWHSQVGEGDNASLILDIDAAALAAPGGGRLLERPFLALGPAARKLVEFMAIVRQQGQAAPALLAGWTPLLLDTLAGQAPVPASRLAALRARIEAEPALPWSTESMARAAHLSVSRLHALFRQEHDCTPHDWLLRVRLARACDELARGSLPIAALALRAGFSDQSALTRAMRRAMDTTPGAYRRARGQENTPTTR